MRCAHAQGVRAPLINFYQGSKATVAMFWSVERRWFTCLLLLLESLTELFALAKLYAIQLFQDTFTKLRL